MSSPSDFWQHLFFSYGGKQSISVPALRHVEASTKPGLAGFLYVARASLNTTLHSASSPLAFSIHGGELIMIPRNTGFLLRNEHDMTIEALLILFRINGSDEALHVLNIQDREFMDKNKLHPFRMPQVRQWISDFETEVATDDFAMRFRLQSHLYMMLSGFIHSIHRPRAQEMDLQNYVEHTRQYILKRLGKKVDMDALARASGVSSSRFYRAFRLHTGMSPLQYTTWVRLNNSLELLAASTAPVAEVSHSVGYEDELYFSRLFRKHLQLTPTEYRAAASRKIAIVSPVFQGDLSVFGIVPHISFERYYAREHPEQLLRKILDSQPDLIFSGPLSAGLHAALSEIAPVHVLKWKEYSWKDRLLRMGQLLGLRPAAQRWLDHFHLKAKNARQHLKQYWGQEPVLPVVCARDRFVIFGRSSWKLNDLFYGELELARPNCIEAIETKSLLSLSEVADIDCPNMIFLVPSGLEHLELARLEEDWRNLGQKGKKKHCMFLPYYGVLNYNAASYDNLVDQCVWRIRQNMLTR